MKPTPRTRVSLLLTSLALLAAAALGHAGLADGGDGPAARPAGQLAQSTSAILEERAA